MLFANFSFLFFPSDGRMGVAVSLISVQIYGYIPTKAHKLRKFLSVTPKSGKKWVISLFSTFLRFFDRLFIVDLLGDRHYKYMSLLSGS